jgi:signal transduction histidine kinase
MLCFAHKILTLSFTTTRCGNEKLRDLARKRSQEYQNASKKGKSQISRELVDAVRQLNPPGR